MSVTFVSPKISTSSGAQVGAMGPNPFGSVSAPSTLPALSMPAAFTSFREPVPSSRLALNHLDAQFTVLLESLDLTAFDPAKMPQYIRNAERRMGKPMSPERREELYVLARSTSPEVLQFLALELKIGYTKKARRAERKAMAALGQLFLERDNTEELKAFIQDPAKNPNVKALVENILLAHRVEQAMGRSQRWMKTWRNKLTGLFTRLWSQWPMKAPPQDFYND